MVLSPISLLVANRCNALWSYSWNRYCWKYNEITKISLTWAKDLTWSVWMSLIYESIPLLYRLALLLEFHMARLSFELTQMDILQLNVSHHLLRPVEAEIWKIGLPSHLGTLGWRNLLWGFLDLSHPLVTKAFPYSNHSHETKKKSVYNFFDNFLNE